jgi:polyhydroxyalkanoate synthase subunit PhaC
LAAKGLKPAASLTLLTTLLDFAEPGILGVFTDEKQVQQREDTLGKGGLMPAKDLNNSFSMLRPNDLIWNYVVNQYLKGQPAPAPFDLLYWNGDSTNLPGPMFAWYLRNLYLENKLARGELQTLGQTIDLSVLTQPSYVLANKEDHIVPWQTAHTSAALLGKRGAAVRFVQGASGHIAGVINPPHKHKRSYKVANKLHQNASSWETSASEQAGSWWPDWADWLAQHSGKQVKPASKLGSASHPVIEAAPGRYVAVRAMPL